MRWDLQNFVIKHCHLPLELVHSSKTPTTNLNFLIALFWIEDLDHQTSSLVGTTRKNRLPDEKFMKKFPKSELTTVRPPTWSLTPDHTDPTEFTIEVFLLFFSEVFLRCSSNLSFWWAFLLLTCRISLRVFHHNIITEPLRSGSFT